MPLGWGFGLPIRSTGTSALNVSQSSMPFTQQAVAHQKHRDHSRPVVPGLIRALTAVNPCLEFLYNSEKPTQTRNPETPNPKPQKP